MTERDPMAAIEAFIAGVDELTGQISQSSQEIAEGQQLLAATEGDLLANQARLRERMLLLASGSDPSSQSATTALEAIAAHIPPWLRAGRADHSLVDSAGLEAAASSACEAVAGAAAHVASGGFASLSHGAEQLTANLDRLCPRTGAAVEGALALCETLSRRLASAREELNGALRDSAEGVGSALTALEQSLGELQLFGEGSATSLEALMVDVAARCSQSVADLETASEATYAEWLASIEPLITEVESQLRGSLTGRIETQIQRLKQGGVRECRSALEDAHAAAASVEAGAPKAEALVPQVAGAKQACLTMAEVMGAMGF